MFQRFERVEPVPERTLDTLTALPGFPAALVDAWREFGTGFIGADGFVRLIDPGKYFGLLPEWFDDSAGAVPFAATGMGDLFVWQGGVIRQVLYRIGHIRDLPMSVDEVLTAGEDEAALGSWLHRAQYPAGVERWGRPDLYEAFFYAPYLPLGGPEQPENLQRGDLGVSLSIFTQMMGRTSIVPRQSTRG